MVFSHANIEGCMDPQSVIEEILAFRDERDWGQFHTPRNLAVALAIEAAELQELMLWKDDSEVTELVASKPGHGELSDEIADVMIYALLFCEAAGIDPEAAIRIKLQKNGEKYPVEKSKGRAAKYSEL
jgi:dCTP diphosphatase